VALSTPVWMGAITKVVVQYPTAFWRADGLAGTAVSTRGPLREVHDLSSEHTGVSALFGFAPGAATNRESLKEQVLDQLVRLFGPEAASPLRVLIQDWSRERYTSPAGVASHNDHHLFGHPRYARPAMDGLLHWASTETSGAAPGHVEGALAAAERATAAVLAALPSKPAVIGVPD
jgi:monoamine oxidase